MSTQPLLILGATGRVGRLLGRVWQGDKTLRWQGRRMAGPVTDPALCFDPLEDPAQLTEAATGAGAILVLAGVTPQSAKIPEDYMLNTDLALAAINAAKAASVPRVLLCSTSAVYGAATGALHEDTPTKPLADYGRAKLAMEQAAGVDTDIETNTGHIAVTALRIGNIAGADQLLGPGARDITLDVFADGQGPRRSYLGPQALARILMALLRHPDLLPSCLNVASAGMVDMAALLRAADLPFTPRPAPDGLPPEVALDTARLATLVPLPASEAQPDTIVADWHAVTKGAPI